jgi:hypothetical protein
LQIELRLDCSIKLTQRSAADSDSDKSSLRQTAEK